MFNFINLLFLFLVVIRYKKIILEYFKKILNIKIIISSLLIYFIIVFLIGIMPMYR